MKTINLNLDGKTVEAREGETILQLARRLGVEIPALCYDPRLPPYASCFVCIVEVEGRRGVVPACATKCEPNMVVRARTESIVKLRRMALELLLSNHHGDCVAPCNMACPAGIDIRSYLAEVAKGKYHRALRVIKERNPFPSVCGRICPHRCEDACRRHLVDDPVAINLVKRYVADLDRASGKPWKPELAARNGKKVAVIGGGPGGMSAAYYLVQLGYEPTVFEAMPKAGGMLRYGVPDYRLPQDVLDAEIRQILDLGVKLECGKTWGKDFHLDDLRQRGFSAILVAIGAWASSAMDMEGEDRPGVWSGIALLEKAAKGEKVSLGDRAVIVGGGNTAIDAARTALRLGSQSVTLVYRRSRKEMPANPEEIHEAEEEGVQFHFLTAPLGFTGADKVAGMRCIKMQLGEPDKSGRRRPVPVPGSEFEMPLDSVVAAIGQKVRWGGFNGDGLKITKWGTLEASEKTLRTSAQDVFAVGDCFTGPATAIEAIAAGRRAALAMHAGVSGKAVDMEAHPFNVTKGKWQDLDRKDYERHPKLPRAATPVLPAAARARTYEEVQKTVAAETAAAEAKRCLLCGCQEVSSCLVRRYSGEYGATGEQFAGEKTKPGPIVEHPFIVRDPEKCILCGRCVRVCSELQGVGAIGLVGRGFVTQVAPAFHSSLQAVNCKSCGQCIATCPAGALQARQSGGERNPAWRTEEVEVVCSYCGTGCRLKVAVSEEGVERLQHKMGAGEGEMSVCAKGFAGFDLLVQPDRLREPMLKEKGRWRPASWDEALKAATEGLAKAAKAKGGKSAAVLGSARLTNEAHYLLQKIGRAALGTNHLGGKGVGGECDVLARAFGGNFSTARREDLLLSDLILTVGFDPETEFAAVASMLRSAARSGAKLHVYHHRATGVDKAATSTLRIAYPDTYALFESWLADLLAQDSSRIGKDVSGLSELRAAMSRCEPRQLSGWLRRHRLDRLRDEFFAAARPLVIVDAASVRDSELACLADLLALKGAVGRPGAGLILLRGACNSQGAIDNGLDGRWLPGYRPVSDPAARKSLEDLWGRGLPDWPGLTTPGIIQAGEVGSLSALLSWGDNGLSSVAWKGAFIAAGEWIKPGPEHPASVVFPAALFLEDDGGLTSWDRRVQQQKAAALKDAPPPNWQSLGRLAEALGLPKTSSLEALRGEMSRASQLYRDGGALLGGKARLLVPREEEARQPMEFLKYLSEADLVGRFIRKRLEEVKSGALTRAGC
ncbi:MAG: FAD-dependent oxidoreductase [Elusimicrobia bacterium]|nr:FAD-dependent oxidoreductase [Elusimicrobiota bacterium]